MSVAHITTITATVAAVGALATAGLAQAAPRYYGTIALSQLKGTAVATTDDSKVGADAAAIKDCASYDCDIVLRFDDGCGAIARGADGKWGWADAGSRAEAEQIAIASLGESAPAFPDLGSASPRAATVIASACTPNTE
ncbi:DUF4189 domain-containing protein [Nocardia crassostreae]|uniref:DUF4189 domain-containing protein n=1 Tax=Nocardia crassostreae TaxID=53428 RepID=UPI000AD472D1|nr:DUF4189 domain-containing protein [Nocardia crassostreae]